MARIIDSRCVLAVQDLAASTHYYVDVLGFKLDFEVPGWSFLSRDNFGLMLGECPDAPPAAELGDHSYFAYLRVESVDGFYREVSSRGAEVRTAPEDKPWGMREFAIRTPDGHRLTVGEEIRGERGGL